MRAIDEKHQWDNYEIPFFELMQSETINSSRESTNAVQVRAKFNLSLLQNYWSSLCASLLNRSKTHTTWYYMHTCAAAKTPSLPFSLMSMSEGSVFYDYLDTSSQ